MRDMAGKHLKVEERKSPETRQCSKDPGGGEAVMMESLGVWRRSRALGSAPGWSGMRAGLLTSCEDSVNGKGLFLFLSCGERYVVGALK